MYLLIPRTAEQAADLLPLLQSKKVKTVFVPLLQMHPPRDQYQALDAALHNIAQFDWLVFTSSHAVEAVGKRWRQLGLHATLPSIVVVGRETAKSLAPYGWKAYYTADGSGEGYLVDFFAGQKKISHQSVLLPKSQIGLPRLEMFLREKGAKVTRVEAYQTLTDTAQRLPLQKALAEGVNTIFFYSPSQVVALAELLPDATQALRSVALYAKGETTRQAILRQGWKCAGLMDENMIFSAR